MFDVVFKGDPPDEPEPSVNVAPEPDEDADLAAILEQSKKDYERAEKFRKQEDEDLKKAINASLMSAPSTSSSTSQANDQDPVDEKDEFDDLCDDANTSLTEKLGLNNEVEEVFHDAVEDIEDDSNALVPESSGLVSSFFIPLCFAKPNSTLILVSHFRTQPSLLTLALL